MYIFESTLEDSKSVSFSLASIYGVGKINSVLVCKQLGFSKNLRLKNLSKKQEDSVIDNIKMFKLLTGSELKLKNQLSLEKLITIKSYKGLRRYKGLPIRGQRTRSNARTARKKIK